MPKKMPEVEFNQWAMRFQRSQLGILSDINIGVMGRRPNACREVFDFQQGVLWSEDSQEKRNRV